MFLLISYFILHRLTGFAIPCVFHKITGWFCPGCGVTRMLFALLRFDFATAFRSNALLFLLLPFGIYLGIDYIIKLYQNKPPVYRKIPDKYWIALLIVTLLYGILRNLALFDFLAP